MKDSASVSKDAILKRLLEATVVSINWTEPVHRAVESCFSTPSDALQSKVQSLVMRHFEATEGNSSPVCFSVGGVVLDCLYIELYRSCPSEAKTGDTDRCDALTEYANECGRF